LSQQIQMVDRRMEWMAAKALVGGSVTIVGENYPSQTVNFNRDSSLTVTLSGANRWGQTGILPTENLLDWSALPLKASGLTVTDVILTPTPWKALRKDTNFVQVIQSFQNAEPTLRASGVAANTG